MDALTIARIAPPVAARLLAGCASLDPAGMVSEESIPGMTRRGQCFLATDAAGDQAVYVLHETNGVTWVDACRALGGDGWSAPIFDAIEREAAASGCASVAFQTARAGLARRAQDRGYEVAGYILRKRLP